jgi:hypothetical protein
MQTVIVGIGELDLIWGLEEGDGLRLRVSRFAYQ